MFSWKNKKIKIVSLALVIVISIVLAILLLGNLTESNIDKLKVHYINVGQGDAILIQQGKYNMLIDAGDNSQGEIVKAYLRKEKVKEIDIVIGTHVHEDHIGGMDDVINSFNISKIYFPRHTSTTIIFNDFINAVINKNLKLTVGKMGESFSFGNARATILAPVKETYDNANDYSIVLKLIYGNTSFLFMGDAEKTSEQDILNTSKDISANVLKVGHHGSNTSSTEKFVSSVNPMVAVISVGLNNKYGHPSKDTISLLNRQNIKILRTDENGTIVITSDGESLNIDKER